MSKCTELLSALSRKGITLWVEDERLHYRARSEVLTREETDALRALKSEVMEVLRLGHQTMREAPAAEASTSLDEAPLTRQQLRVWQAIQRGAISHLGSSALRIRGQLCHERLRKSCDQLMRRHDALRTQIVTVDGVPIQRFRKPENALIITDLSGLSSEAIEARVQAVGHGIMNEHCDLARDPLFQMGLFKVSDQEHVLLWGIHHIISDTIAFHVLFDELWRHYERLGLGEGNSIDGKVPQYAHYSKWQQAALQERRRERYAHWQSRLDGANGICWPFRTTAEHEVPLSDKVPISFGRALSERLREITAQAGTTLGMAALTLYAVATARLCQQRDLIVTTSVSGRDRPELERLLGYCAYPLYLRIRLASDETFARLLTKVSQEFQAALSHSDSGAVVAEHPELLGHGLFQWAAWPEQEPWDSPASRLKPLGLQASLFPKKFVLKSKHPFSDYHLMLSLGESDEGVRGFVFCSPSAVPAIQDFSRVLHRVAEEMTRSPYELVR